MAGMMVNFFLYLDRERTFNGLIDGLSLLLLFGVFLQLATKKRNADRAVTFHVVIVVLNFCISILAKAIRPTEESQMWILMTIAVSIVPVLFAGMTTQRRLPVIVALAIIVSYTAASVIMNDVAMMSQIPSTTLLFAAMAFGYSYILHIARLTRLYRHKIGILSHKTALFILYQTKFKSH